MEHTILRRSIPTTGELLPVIGLGTWQTFDVGKDKIQRTTLKEVMQAFLLAVGSIIDSSPMYGSAEEVVGDLTQELQLREKLF